MSHEIQAFDPNAASTDDSGVFGLPFSESNSRLVLVPVPWEVTTSYGGGTSRGPEAILQASRQVDLFDLELGRPYESGIFMRAERGEIGKMNEEGRSLASQIIEVGGQIEGNQPLEKSLVRVNELGRLLNQSVLEETRSIFRAKKIPGLVGGDHSIPLGAFQAAAEAEGDFGVLHFDAHSDTRDAFEGFQWSHASIMRNALDRVPQIKKLVQVGIRDFCEEEWSYCQKQNERVSVFYDSQIQDRKFQGEHWSQIADAVVQELPQKVWISFDIDGLDPRFCPNTGTPVPGGLEFAEATDLIRRVAKSGRRIIGFDLNEVSPGDGDSEWDGNVGARLLYKLCGWTLFSQK